MKIAYKLVLGFMVIYVLMAVNANNGVQIMINVRDEVSVMMNDDYVSAIASERMITALYDVNLQEAYFLAMGEAKYLDAYNESKGKFIQYYTTASMVIRTDEEHGLLNSINQSFRAYDGLHLQIVDLYNDGQIQDANNLSLGASNAEFYKTYQYCIQLENLNTDSMERSHTTVDNSMTMGVWSLIGLNVVSLIVAMVLGFGISNSIVKGIIGLTKGTKSISRGEFGQVIEIESKDELGGLAHAFNEMSMKLLKRETELSRKSEEINAANIELKKMDTLKSLLLGNVSHELRTPLASIKGHVELVLDEQIGEINDAQKEMLTIANQDTDHLDRLVEELLVVSVIEFDRLKLKCTHLRLDEPLDWASSRLAKQLRNKNITLDVQMASSLPEVYADRDKIVQVFINLLKNSINYTPPNSTIRIESICRNDSIITMVIDHGIGIAKSNLEKIFDKFYQVNPSSTRQVGGVGLGLYICKGIIEAHGGKIWAESELGKGTTILFSLPMIKDGGRKFDKENARHR